MSNTIVRLPEVANETVLDYAPGSRERAELISVLEQVRDERIEIPIIIGGVAHRGEKTVDLVCPHDHRLVLARVHTAGEGHVAKAIEAAKKAARGWAQTRWETRAAIFLRAAELAARPWRARLLAATMLGQSKTPHQAEIDAACEVIDFLRWNTHFARDILSDQPISREGAWNQVDYRPLEGFVFSVTPFNFTAIATNLASSPAFMGNVVLWKPAENATLACYHVYRLLEEAGLPAGVINFLPGRSVVLAPPALEHPDLAGVHFTGSTAAFHDIWQRVGRNIARYRNYPRLVGETGGKDFIVAHSSADVPALTTAIVRGAYEYQGQKCSAASRAYLPRGLYSKMKADLANMIDAIPIGDPTNFANFMGALINRRGFDRVRDAIQWAQQCKDADVLAGGQCDDSSGYFIRPTLVETRDPANQLMQEEYFGPLLTVYAYEDSKYEDTLRLCEEGSVYALTGSVFASERSAIEMAEERLRYAAGNFYINDKPTGAIVNQQPFGGGRASGTNDKAGSQANLRRWVSPRVIKETFVSAIDYRYRYMG